MAQSNWEADKMLDVYIHDYFLKRKLHNSAKAFLAEGKVATDPVAIDAPGGFLFEWWSVFWDIFIARTNDKHSEPAAAYIESQQMKARDQLQMNQLQMNQLQLMQQRNGQLQRRDPNHPPLAGPMGGAMNSEMGQPSASALAMKMYEERMKHSHSLESDTSSSLVDANRLGLLKSTTNHQGQLVQSSSGGMSPGLQQIQGQGRPQMITDIKVESTSGSGPNQKSLPMDPASIYGQVLQSKSGLGGAGLNQGVTGLPLKGWPLTGIDQLRPSVGMQAQRPNLQNPNQFLMTSQQQQALAQAQAQGNIGAPNYGFSGMARGNFNTKEGQPPRNDGPICSPGQSNSPKMKMAQMQQTSAQQQPDQLQHQQQQQLSQQNNRKRKPHSSSGAANSTETGNTAGPSPNSPPSTHTPGDGINTSSNLQHVNSVSKPFAYSADGVGGMASSTNQLDDLENFIDAGSLEDNVESFLSHDGGDGDVYGTTPKQTFTDHKTETSKSFSFGENGCIRTRDKVLCCHFSSDGKLLASAGYDRKTTIWNMDNMHMETTPEEHKNLISDVRFRPNSTQLATASRDHSVRLWDAANPSYSLHSYTHASPITSLDFHPKKNDLFCFCDGNNEIRYWNINPFTFYRMSKQGGSLQVRFQPTTGRLLAAASEKLITVYDVESDRQIHSFQEHSGAAVSCLSWDLSGDYLSSVTKESVKIWSMASGELIHELSANGTEFHSCVFHPNYSALLVVGGMQSLELWNMVENKSMTVTAHDNIITALAQSSVTGMVASGSFDSSVKLWK